MGFSKKAKRKEATKNKKNDKYQNKKCIQLTKSEEKCNTENEELFTLEELQELRDILKIDDLTQVPHLVCAVIIEKFELIKKLIKQGLNIDEEFDNATALIWAVKQGNFKIIDYLMSNGANVSLDNENILFVALNCNTWEENPFMGLWFRVKKTRNFDVNCRNKSNFTLLHFACKRKWALFAEALIQEEADIDCTNFKGVTPLILAVARNDIKIVKLLLNANANILHEDARGCTPICYVLGNIVQKRTHFAQKILEMFTKKILLNKGYSFEEYLERRLYFLLNPPANITAYIYVIGKILAPILEYFVNFYPNGMTQLLKLKIFQKFTKAIEIHINNLEYVQAAIGALGNMLKWCSYKCTFFPTEVAETAIINEFTFSGMANICLLTLISYRNSSDMKQLLRTCLLPIFLACTSDSLLTQEWLRTHLAELEPFYRQYLDDNTENDNLEDEDIHIKQKLEKFQEVFETIKNEIIETTKAATMTKTTQSVQTILTADTKQSSEDSNQVRKASKRLRRKNRARIAKIRSANVAERLNLNNITTKTSSKEIIEQTENFHPDKNSDVKCSALNGNSKTTETQEIIVFNNSNFESQDFETESNEIIETKSNNIIASKSIESTSVQKKLSETASKQDEVSNDTSQYLSVKNSSSSFKSSDSGLLLYDDVLNLEVNNDNVKIFLDNNTIAAKRAEFSASITQLRVMFNDIIDKYQYIWDIESKLNHPEYIGGYGDEAHPLIFGNREKQIEYIKVYLPFLELQQISKLTENFEKTIERIEELFYINDDSYKSLVTKLKHFLTEHKIRDKPFLSTDISSENDEPYEEEVVNKFGAIGDKFHFRGPTYMQLVENVLPNHYSNLTDTKSLEASTSKKSMKMEENSKCIIKTSYKSISSTNVTNACDLNESFPYDMKKSKSSDIDTSSGKKNKYFTILSKNVQNNISVFEISNQVPKVDCPEIINLPSASRWGTAIRSLQMYMKKEFSNKEVADEEVVLSCSLELRPRYIIATGGNFGDVELALNSKGYPLALKRISSNNSSVFRLVTESITPLLKLRHHNILEYVACNRDHEGDIYLATPLCEFNLGEYLMCLKLDESRCERYYAPTSIMYLLSEFVNGLRYLHEQSEPIIHGNLKPSNVLIDKHGHLRLAEFGIHKTLYQSARAPKSSMIWFARETYVNYEQNSVVECTKASDIQVAGMLLHFINTKGLHPFGIVADDILTNLMNGVPTLHNGNCEIDDLISWMLSYEPSERPTINQVYQHAYFWDENTKWRFILACCGMNDKGQSEPELILNDFYPALNGYAETNYVEGDWVTVLEKHYRGISLPLDANISRNTVTGLLNFIRSCIEEKRRNAMDNYNIRFFSDAFPALSLTLYRLIDNTEWMQNPVFMRFLEHVNH